MRKSWQRRANLYHVWKWNFRSQPYTLGLRVTLNPRRWLETFFHFMYYIYRFLPPCISFRQKKALHSSIYGCQPPCFSWELNSETMKEQPEDLTGEPPLQSLIWNFLDYILSHVTVWSHKWIKWTSYWFFSSRVFSLSHTFYDTQKSNYWLLGKKSCKIHFNNHSRVDTFILYLQRQGKYDLVHFLGTQVSKRLYRKAGATQKIWSLIIKCALL